MKPATVVGRLGVLAGLAWAGAAAAQTPELMLAEATAPHGRLTARARPPVPVPLGALPPGLRESIVRVVQQPTLFAHGPAEEFPGGLYDWLVEHPDRVALAWQRLGVPCVAITDRGQGRFGWSDGQGSDLTWRTVWRGPGERVWYAEGQAKAGPLLPVMPVRAVAVLRHSRRQDAGGQLLVTHEVDVYLLTDSKAATLVTRLLGPAAPRLAEQGATQLLLFFSALARHLDEHPEQVQSLLKG